MTTDSKQIKRFIGTIVSHKAQKTATVLVSTVKTHPKYHKRYTETKKYYAHDENNQYQTGDVVEIIPHRPMSRMKRFVVTRKIS